MKIRLLAVFLMLGACTRAPIENNLVKMQMPDSAKLLSTNRLAALALPVGKKICFGVNVRGTDIVENKTCEYRQGVLAGFAEANATLEVTVPNGQNRSFQLVAHVVDEAVACTSWAALNQNRLDWVNLFTAGSVSGITLDGKETVIDIPVSLNSNSLGFLSGDTACGSAGVQLQAALLENGDIVDGSSTNKFPIDVSMSYLDSISISLTDLEPLWIYLSNSSKAATRGDSVTSPVVLAAAQNPHVSSIVTNPNSGFSYGQLVDGKIVAVNLGNGSYSSLSSCPFSSCRLPVWMQSFSIGLGGKIYGLDHGGNVYYVSDYLGQPQVSQVLSVPSYVRHVVVF